jgi:hypothetical protein
MDQICYVLLFKILQLLYNSPLCDVLVNVLTLSAVNHGLERGLANPKTIKLVMVFASSP